MKQGVIIGFLGKTQDRFSEYQQPVTVKEKLEIVKQIEGFDGVEIVFPYETGDAEETKGWMKELGLKSFRTVGYSFGCKRHTYYCNKGSGWLWF